MLSRASLGRSAQQAIRRQTCTKVQSRGLASPASGSFQYETGEAAGVRFASRDIAGPVTNLALVARAGTRYQWAPGLTEGLQRYAFKATHKRSALRITREAELLGAELDAYHTRESLILRAGFIRGDLPYFVELLAEVASKTKYQPHEFHEEVEHGIKLSQKRHLGDVEELAVNSAHGVAFHRGLGTPLYPTSSTPLNKYLNAQSCWAYSVSAYAKPNISVVANGVEHSELNKWVNEFFQDLPDSVPSELPPIESTQTKYYGGEERIAHGSGNSMILAFPGSSSYTGPFYKPEISVLAALLGGESSIKWSAGFSLLPKAAENTGCRVRTRSAIYSDAGLLYVSLNGSAAAIRQAATSVVDAIKSIANGETSKEDIAKAKAQAKFKELEFGQVTGAGLELTGSGLISTNKPYQLDEVAKMYEKVSGDQIKEAAKSLLKQRASVSAVGDLYVLPFAEEIGLTV